MILRNSYRNRHITIEYSYFLVNALFICLVHNFFTGLRVLWIISQVEMLLDDGKRYISRVGKHQIMSVPAKSVLLFDKLSGRNPKLFSKSAGK
jgi:hypothetical protein